VRRSVFIAVLLALVADAARAQIIRPVRRDNPIAWTSLSVGFLQQQSFHDPTTDADWDFGSGFQFRGTLEIPLGGATLGLAGSIARLPMIYRGPPATARSCFNCDADANISQLLANFRIGGGSGFHQVIDLMAGYTFFHNFQGTDGTPLGPEKAVTDFTFGLGYGFGYNFTSRAQLMVVQDLMLMVHKRLPGNADNVLQQRTLRVGGRFALGSKN
jgi:hypothetical protein